jgi:hypothetical protein
MNWSGFIGGVIRAMGPAIIAWLVARNVTPEIASTLVQYLADAAAAVIALASAAWSIRGKLAKNQVADVIARPEVRSIKLDPELAAATAAAAPKYASKITTTQ